MDVYTVVNYTLRLYSLYSYNIQTLRLYSVHIYIQTLSSRDVQFDIQIESDWPQMVQIWEFLRSVSVHFGSPILKSHFGLIWLNLDAKFDILGE